MIGKLEYMPIPLPSLLEVVINPENLDIISIVQSLPSCVLCFLQFVHTRIQIYVLLFEEKCHPIRVIFIEHDMCSGSFTQDIGSILVQTDRLSQSSESIFSNICISAINTCSFTENWNSGRNWY